MHGTPVLLAGHQDVAVCAVADEDAAMPCRTKAQRSTPHIPALGRANEEAAALAIVDGDSGSVIKHKHAAVLAVGDHELLAVHRTRRAYHVAAVKATLSYRRI